MEILSALKILPQASKSLELSRLTNVTEDDFDEQEDYCNYRIAERPEAHLPWLTAYSARMGPWRTRPERCQARGDVLDPIAAYAAIWPQSPSRLSVLRILVVAPNVEILQSFVSQVRCFDDLYAINAYNDHRSLRFTKEMSGDV